MSEGASPVANQQPASNVTTAYDAFLFAPVDHEPGGMRLSVLSALARMNVDPWEEAARLATLSTSDAERTLVSTLNLLPGPPHTSTQTELLAARLVALLPKARVVTTATTVAISSDPKHPRNYYWLAWLCFGIVMSFLSLHQQVTSTSVGDSTPERNAAPAADTKSAESAASDANTRARFDEATLPTVPSTGSTSP
jgi:hypothetical protein